MEVEEIPKEFSESKRFLDLCFYWMFIEVIPKFKWKVLNGFKLSVFPLITVLNGIFIVNEFLKIVFAINAKNQMKFSYLIVYFGGIYQYHWKYFVLIAYSKEYQKIVEFISDICQSITLKTLFSSIRRQRFPKTLKIALFCVKFYLIFTILAVILVLGANTIMTNFTSPLMYTIPFLPEESLFFRPINVIFQWIAFIVLCIVIFGSEFILMITVGYLEAEFNTFVDIIAQMNNENVAKTDGRAILRQILTSQVKIFEIMKDLQTIYWHLSLHILLSNFMFICLSLYVARFISLSIPTAFTLCNGFFQLFIFCNIGQILLNRTDRVADALWETSWYNLTLEDQKIFLVILCMAQKTKGIGVCGLTTVSANTLLQVLKTSVTYGAFLYTLIN